MSTDYDASRATYALTRQTDPSIAAAIERALAPGRVVLFTFDPARANGLWFIRDYLPELAAVEAARFVPIREQVALLGPGTRVERVPIPHDCRDPLVGAFWRRPDRYLEPDIGPYAALPPAVLRRGLDKLRNDLDSGAWRRRYGGLLSREALDVGYRLVVARLGSSTTSSD